MTTERSTREQTKGQLTEEWQMVATEVTRLLSENARLREALQATVNSIEEAVRLSALHNGHEYSFKTVIEYARTALKPGGE